MSEDLGFGEGPEAGMVCGGLVWDQHLDCHQLEALNHAVHASCELGFEKVMCLLGLFVDAVCWYSVLWLSSVAGILRLGLKFSAGQVNSVDIKQVNNMDIKHVNSMDIKQVNNVDIKHVNRMEIKPCSGLLVVEWGLKKVKVCWGCFVVLFEV